MNPHETLAVDSFIFNCEAKRLTDKTLSVYQERLDYLIRWAAEKDQSLLTLQTSDVQQYLLSLMRRGLAGITINGRLKLYRQFYRYLLSQELIGHDPTGGIPLVRCERRVRPVTSREDLKRVIRAVRRRRRGQFFGLRAEIMLMLGYDTMCRLNELISIRLDDMSIRDRTVRVFGKGRKERILGFAPTTAARLLVYLAQRAKLEIPGELLFSTKRGRRLIYRNVRHIFERCGQLVDPPVALAPHQLRRSAATHYYEDIGNILLIRNILGHEDVTTTQQYLKVEQQDVLRSYERRTPVSALNI